MSAHQRNQALSRRSLYRHWMMERVRWSDTDKIGHVNNLAYAAYCETGRSHFLREVLSPATGPRAMLLIAELKVNFIAEAHWPAEIDIGSGVLWVGRSSCCIGQGLFDGERCVATAESVLVLIDEDTRVSRSHPDWLVSWLKNHLFPDQPPNAQKGQPSSQAASGFG